MRRDAIVVGAGLVGAALAVRLAGAGMRVVLLERGVPPAGDSARSFGMVRAHYSNAVTVKLARRGIALLAGWPPAAYVRTGYLLTVPPALRDACAANVALGAGLGVDTRLLVPDELGAVEPALRLDGVAAAAYEPDGGIVDPPRMVLAWLAEALALGVEVRLGTAALAVAAGAVATAAGRFAAPVVVVAAGGWSPALLPALPIELRRIQVAQVRPLRLRAVVSDAVTNVVARPAVGETAWAVAYAPEAPFAAREDVPDGADDDYGAAVARALGERYHVPDGLALDRAWGGAYDAAPDWNPIVGELEPGLWVAAGLSGHGLKLAPAIAESLAAVIAGEEPPVDLTPLRPGRFAEGEPLALAYGPSARA
jgi:sarcosine oxidase subunit beta